jgi:DNA-binding response OmpR family regulator
MLSDKELRKIEIELHETGLSEEVRSEIRKSRICIIDDKIDDLKSLHDNLKKEGFNNLEKHKKSPPINVILNSKFDLIILDLNDVATELTEEDGKGILKLLKERQPNLPILIVTGQGISPDDHRDLNYADLLRKKPILASDLASDVETVLKHTRDKFWGAINILKELNRIDIELKKEITLYKRWQLHRLRKAIEKKLINREEDIIDKISNIAKILNSFGSLTFRIVKITTLIVP